MSAIQPNKNFDNERQEHVSYEDSVKKKMQALYEKMKTVPGERVRTREVRDTKAYNKWFRNGFENAK